MNWINIPDQLLLANHGLYLWKRLDDMDGFTYWNLSQSLVEPASNGYRSLAMALKVHGILI